MNKAFKASEHKLDVSGDAFDAIVTYFEGNRMTSQIKDTIKQFGTQLCAWHKQLDREFAGDDKAVQVRQRARIWCLQHYSAPMPGRPPHPEPAAPEPTATSAWPVAHPCHDRRPVCYHPRARHHQRPAPEPLAIAGAKPPAARSH